MQLYRARNPRKSPLWQCAHRHFATFAENYAARANYFHRSGSPQRREERRGFLAGALCVLPVSAASPGVSFGCGLAAQGVSWFPTPPPPAKLPSKKWRDLILHVWHTDPLICPKCRQQMRVIAVIDQRVLIGKILRHLGLWNGTPHLAPARAPPDADTGSWTREPCDDVDPMPDYENVLTD